MKQTINKEHSRIKNRDELSQEMRDERAYVLREEKQEYEKKIAGEIVKITAISKGEQEQLCRDEIENALTTCRGENDTKNYLQNAYRVHNNMMEKVKHDKEFGKKILLKQLISLFKYDSSWMIDSTRRIFSLSEDDIDEVMRSKQGLSYIIKSYQNFYKMYEQNNRYENSDGDAYNFLNTLLRVIETYKIPSVWYRSSLVKNLTFDAIKEIVRKTGLEGMNSRDRVFITMEFIGNLRKIVKLLGVRKYEMGDLIKSVIEQEHIVYAKMNSIDDEENVRYFYRELCSAFGIDVAIVRSQIDEFKAENGIDDEDDDDEDIYNDSEDE